MPQIPLTLDKGLVTSRDPLRLQVGELTICRGAYYLPDDPDRLWKLPGRVNVGPFRSVAEGTLLGLTYNAYENGRNALFAARTVGQNGGLYTADPEDYIWKNATVTRPWTDTTQTPTVTPSGGLDSGTLAKYEVEMITGSTYVWRTTRYGASDTAGTTWAYTSGTLSITTIDDPIPLNNGVYIQFSHMSGYIVGSKFQFYAYSTSLWGLGKEPRYLKGINDSYDRFILLSGGQDPPRLVDSDGNIRNLGIRPTQTVLKFDSFLEADDSEDPIRPDSDVGGTNPFLSPDKAYDVLSDTYALARMTNGVGGTITYQHTFLWSDTSATDDIFVWIDLEMLADQPTASRPRPSFPDKVDDIREDPAEVYRPMLRVELSEDTGATWVKVFETFETYSRKFPLQITLSAGKTLDEIQIRVTTSRIRTGVDDGSLVITRVFDIFAGVTPRDTAINTDWEDNFDDKGNAGTDGIADSGGILGDSGPVPAVFYYAITEVYKQQTSDGKTIEVESLPCSAPLKVEFPPGVASDPVNGKDVYAVKISRDLDQSGLANTTARGYSLGNLYYRIYRTALTGVVPNMGLVSGDIPAVDFNTGKAFIDTFTVEADSLSPYPLPTYSIGGQIKLLCNPPSAVRDACLFRGSLVIVPEAAPYLVQWALPGFPEYFPEDHVIQPAPTEGGDEIKAIATTGESVLVFLRRRVLRIRELFFVSDPEININQAQVTVLSPSEGLAGSPRSICQFTTQFGRSIVAWVSDSGLWYTDAALVYERGVGVHKMSGNLDWQTMVDTSRLDETLLTYDPVNQIMWFDYYDPQGERQALAIHVSRTHWMEGVASGEELIPKITGPHGVHLLARIVGELDGQLIHWTMADLNDIYYLFTEGGTTDEAHFLSARGDIETLIRTGWMYLVGPSGKFTAFKGNIFHTDWGQNNLSLLAEFREDKRGIIQRIPRNAISLLGSRVTRFWLAKAGHSLRLSLRHVGSVDGALGPIVLTIEGTEED